MKKLVVLALAALCVVAFSIPAWAMEVEFGGYFRTRYWIQEDWYGFDDEGNFDSEAQNLSNFDQRTRLYLTAIFHENLQFVNKFEFDAQWGAPGGLGRGYEADGDIGTDGVGIEVKNSYADFDLGPVNFKVGLQGAAMGSSFLLDTDVAGATITYMGENMVIPFLYFKAFEGDSGRDADDFDVDVIGLYPEFAVGDFGVNPFFMYWFSEDARNLVSREGEAAEDLNLWYAGLTLEWDADPLWMWATGIYQGGDADLVTGGEVDFKAYLAAAGFDMDFGGMFSVHGEGFYSSGEDDDDNDYETFFVPGSADSYYWAEIMGFGIFDYYVPHNAPADQIENVWAANLGFTVRPMDKLKVTFDAWYAQKAEEILLAADTPAETMGDELGLELDLVLTYELVEGLNLDVVGAYLFAEEVITNNDIAGDDDPYLVGSRLSLSF